MKILVQQRPGGEFALDDVVLWRRRLKYFEDLQCIITRPTKLLCYTMANF